MTNNDQFQVPKAWWRSKTIIGLLLSIVTKSAALFGHELGLEENLSEILLLTSFIGDAIAGYGRKKAEGPLVT